MPGLRLAPSMGRAWLSLALFAIGFLLFLLAPLAVLGVAALAYGTVAARGRRRLRAAQSPVARGARPSALQAARGNGFGTGFGDGIDGGVA